MELPYELWVLVFGFLNYHDLKAVVLTCHAFLQSVKRSERLLAVLRLPSWDPQNSHSDVKFSHCNRVAVTPNAQLKAIDTKQLTYVMCRDYSAFVLPRAPHLVVHFRFDSTPGILTSTIVSQSRHNETGLLVPPRVPVKDKENILAIYDSDAVNQLGAYLDALSRLNVKTGSVVSVQTGTYDAVADGISEPGASSDSTASTGIYILYYHNGKLSGNPIIIPGARWPVYTGIFFTGMSTEQVTIVASPSKNFRPSTLQQAMSTKKKKKKALKTKKTNKKTKKQTKKKTKKKTKKNTTS
eukprot:TRINITY_DN4904_c0_g1_i1.p1 TRINITY_DN4904_c0_g1~~TRINITY_DN4904_c0_g1_i1.p1  ORF type:complete len:297 (+),score=47.42 TRINITY_DN4904_c0_g1_i1:27-917(+)